MPVYDPDGKEKDLYDRANTDEPFTVYGKWTTNLWECLFVKGVGKVPATPANKAQYPDKRPALNIDQMITPVDPTLKTVERGAPEFAQEWKAVTRESVNALAAQIAQCKGLAVGQFMPIREINGMFVKAQLVPRPGLKAGETWTCFKIVEVYADQSACAAAYDEWKAKRDQASAATATQTGLSAISQAAAGPTQAALPQAPQPPSQRSIMGNFLPPLWVQAGGKIRMTDDDMGDAISRLEKLIAGNPMLAEHFTVTSPEVLAITEAVEIDIPF